MAIAINIEKSGEWEKVTYSGPINEEAEVHLNQLNSQLGPKVIINFKQVTLVNSCGVRGWVNFMRALEPNRQIVYEECTSEIVMQINMIPSFKGCADIQSVYGEFSCEECGHGSTILFEKGRNLPANELTEIEAVKCSKCGEDMEMEELEDEFFAFVAA